MLRGHFCTLRILMLFLMRFYRWLLRIWYEILRDYRWLVRLLCKILGDYCQLLRKLCEILSDYRWLAAPNGLSWPLLAPIGHP